MHDEIHVCARPARSQLEWLTRYTWRCRVVGVEIEEEEKHEIKSKNILNALNNQLTNRIDYIKRHFYIYSIMRFALFTDHFSVSTHIIFYSNDLNSQCRGRGPY